MDRFIINVKVYDDNESSVAGSSSGSITHSTISASSKTAVRQYNEEYCLDKMWEPRRLTTLWAFAACYTFTFYLKMTSIGRNMSCAYTSDVEEILTFKSFKGSKTLHVRRIITNRTI
jgi:hypothetical protein